MDINVLDFGAVGDGVTLDTAAIQAAIDACAGGRVVFPGGHVFRSGRLTLHSDMELRFEAGAVLRGSDDVADYLAPGADNGEKSRDVPTYENCEYDGMPKRFFIYAGHCRNVTLSGPGKIDGNQQAFYGEVTRWHIEGAFYPRAPMLFFEDCDDVTVREVTLTKSAFWTVHLVGCRDVLIDGVRILNDLRMANCDGIDPDHCRNVRIANCHIEAADDCIVFKNTLAAMKYGPCENITVTNCTLTSTSAAIKFGTESEDVFRNILVENCVISRSNRGISLQLRDAGSIENVSFRNIFIETRLFHPDMYWGSAEPIAITVLPRHEGTKVGTVRNVFFSGIMCEGENGALFYSHAPGGISDLVLDNVSVRLRSVTAREKGLHDLRPKPGIPDPEPGLSYITAHNVHNSSFRYLRLSADDEMAEKLVSPMRLSSCEGLEVSS